MTKKVALIGYGYLGKAYHKVFPDAVIYDEPIGLIKSTDAVVSNHIRNYFIDKNKPSDHQPVEEGSQFDRDGARDFINKYCDMAIVAVPTDLNKDQELDMSIIEDVIGWLDTPLILIKSALMPGTVDRLVEKTGKKIAVSVEFIGQGSYYQSPHKYPDPKDPSKHDMLIVGGELDTATKCAEILWAKMSPDIKIHLLTAREAEMCKLLENSWAAFKVTWANCMYNLIEKGGGNPMRTHQAWQSDGRTEGMHTRVVSYNRGWKSHCFTKDIPALQAYANSVGASDMERILGTVLAINNEHLELNDVGK